MSKFLQALGLQEAAVAETSGDVVEVPAGQWDTVLYRLEESMAQLQMAAEDSGWAKINADLVNEFSREGLKRIATNGRLMAIANPLIKRGLGIRHAYVWGQGVQISARDEGVNAVVQAFLDREDTKATFTGAQARERRTKAQGTDGNIFRAHFTNPLDGTVRVRNLPFDEITEIVTAPGDKTEAWYYLRVWQETTPTATFGTGLTREQKAYYPALTYQPLTKPKRLGDVEIRWDAPVLHEKVNDLEGWLWGIGDTYAALPYARAYKEFIEDWVLLVKSLSKIAYQAVPKKGLESQKMRQAVQVGQGAPAGSWAVGSEGTKIEAVPKTGATIDSESGRPVAALVAAALGVSVIDLLADPGQAGNRATAVTMDLVKRLEMRGRQELCEQTDRATLDYVIEQAIIAPRGPLKGTVVRDGDRLYATPAGDAENTIEFAWPALDEVPLDIIMKAIEIADGTGTVPKVEILKLILHALDVDEADEIIDRVTDADGNLIDPLVTAGDDAARRFRAGQDPSEGLR
ncbi:hypothetical protein [Arthrobacter burdickii]|uniref:Portal protein n=1 Tax=Arthrobacter burdickii TaxID=3035920 RepID=A0ABT8K3D6_9MICC|nr:hypothetical protein [Arthrobacter burdickii]MDN4611943.1 hypothetical protein [Arthrobacter burdickii]